VFPIHGEVASEAVVAVALTRRTRTMPKIKKFDFTKVIANPLSVIQLLKPVLDDAYARIAGTVAKKDAAIQAAIEYFVKSYEDLREGDDIEYSPPANRFAYLFRYVTANASVVVEILKRSPELEELFDRDEVDVASIGGGPGSEVVALLKYAAERHKTTALNFHLYDCDNSWADTWSRLHKQVKLPVEMFPMFKHLDGCDKATWRDQAALHDADLITMVFFVSEVYKHADLSESFFRQLFKNVKKGALVLYVDNSKGGFTEWFDGLADECGLMQLHGEDRESFRLSPWLEEKSDFGEFVNKFGSPKIRSDVAWRVLGKK
jgi:SAM-dependent methyltransferase